MRALASGPSLRLQQFGGPKAVLAYLSRYTHRVAISNRRLIRFDPHGVTFRYKDYCTDGRARYKRMTLATDEFIRRFLIHVLPKGLHCIRHIHLILLIFWSSCDFYARLYARFRRRMRTDGGGQRMLQRCCPGPQ
jgi:hypothetical protein